jgi:hypothetical protein
MLVIEESPIKLVEGDEPLLEFVLTTTDPVTLETTLYDMVGKSARFVVRNVVQQEDISEYLSTGASPPVVITGSTITVQIGTEATETPGTFRYYLQVITDGHPRTVRKGDWEIENI